MVKDHLLFVWCILFSIMHHMLVYNDISLPICLKQIVSFYLCYNIWILLKLLFYQYITILVIFILTWISIDTVFLLSSTWFWERICCFIGLRSRYVLAFRKYNIVKEQGKNPIITKLICSHWLAHFDGSKKKVWIWMLHFYTVSLHCSC